ncbi:MAG: Gx transporter family protein [Desulfobacterales bacterium]|jgi:heptaprenyl diphosphate synthase|nr:Gx transporter family protein [Desulfobacterales bacterium]
MAESQTDRKLSQIAILVALACVLQIAESFIPHPVPGLRLGLANMMTLTAMILLGFGPAMEVALLRTVLSAFIMGSFMSPTFILSFSGAVVSTAVMGFFYWLSGTHRYFRLSVVGISILGAFTHNMVQLSLAYFLLVKHGGIFVFFPWLSIGAVATGWVVGVVTGGVCRRVVKGDACSIGENPTEKTRPSFMRPYQHSTSFLHRMPASGKLSAIFVLAVCFFVICDVRAYLAVFMAMVFLAAVSQLSLNDLFSQIKRYAMLLAMAFLLPVCFDSGTDVIATIGALKITASGLHLGMLFAFRILLLLFASCLLMRTTSPGELTRGLAQVLFPLSVLGISRHRVATVLTLALEAVPAAWGATRGAMATADLKKVHTLKNLIPLLSDMIAALYLRAGLPDVQREETAPKKSQRSMDVV